jgi:DNA-binding transcriptional MerR regulator
MKNRFSVKELADLAGVTVRTLHLYDEIGLLSPANRTDAGYRWYGEAELLRLQQVLFYKELAIPLKDIAAILDDPGFNVETALENHRFALQRKQERISAMLRTIDTTISKLKKGIMKDYKELYDGFSAEDAESLHNEAVEAYGKETVERSEHFLGKLSKEDINRLKDEQQDIAAKLLMLVSEHPANPAVQEQIARHYHNIRMFWGTAGNRDPQFEAYKGLGELYVSDQRFTVSMNGESNPAFGKFVRDAMAIYADTMLK